LALFKIKRNIFKVAPARGNQFGSCQPDAACHHNFLETGTAQPPAISLLKRNSCGKALDIATQVNALKQSLNNSLDLPYFVHTICV